MKLFGKIILGLVGGILSFILIVIMVFTFSPNPTARLLKWAFANPSYELPDQYEELYNSKVTQSAKDVSYESAFADGYLDIYEPKNLQATDRLPIIIWTHGGAFVAGDKLDHEHYMIMLASNGYVVVNINYLVAPKGKYPTPIKQIGEAYTFIKNNSEKYHADINNLIFGGDSAGAQLASQFVSIQVNEEYEKLIGIDSVVPKETIKGTLLFCGIYSFVDLYDQPKVMGLPNFFMKRIGWAYMGSKNWFELAKPLEVINYLDDSFPPTYVTDGDRFSFREQAEDFTDKLVELGISHISYLPENELPHEYQFNLGKYAEAKTNYDEVIKFLVTIL